MIKTSLLIGTLFILIGSVQAAMTPEYLLRNNVEHRKYLRGVTIKQKVIFSEGFYSPISFSCDETISYRNLEAYRIDYICDGIGYTVLRTGNNYSIIHNNKIETLSDHTPSFLFGIFLYKKHEDLFRLMSDFGFVKAELSTPEPEPKDEETDPPSTDKTAEPDKQELEWAVSGKIELTRLKKIEKGTEDKMEKNTVLLLTSPENEDKKIWFDKDLYLPQKITYGGREIIVKNYKEISNKYKRFFRYPKNVEISENDVLGISIETEYDEMAVNPKFEPNHFHAKTILEQRTTSFKGKTDMKEVLVKFIQDYR